MLGRLLERLRGRSPRVDPVAELARADRLETEGRLSEATAAYRRALAAAPAHLSKRAVGWNNLGWVLQRRSLLEEAAEAYSRALSIDPALVVARNNLGTVHRLRGDLDAALVEYARANRDKPDDPVTHMNLGTVLLKQGEATLALEHLRLAAQRAPKNDEIQRALMLALNCLPGLDHDAAFAIYRHWGERCAARVGPARGLPSRDRDPARRLRIGYLSPDFRAHAVAGFFEPALEHHDRAAVDVFCYDNSPASDAVTERLKRGNITWRDIRGRGDEAVAGLIAEDRIDVLVDLAGHTSGHRLEVFARRAAPVQASLLGYLNTTGLATMDWRISDAVCDPPGDADRWHIEKLWRLEGSFWCWRLPTDAPEVSPLPARSGGAITFGSFNNFTKLNRELTQCWAAILRALPGSRLLVAGAPAGGTRERFVARFTDAGIDAERLELVERLPVDAFRRLHHRVDVALDTFPYSGGATTCESLWMGVPVLTLAGRMGFERSATGLLTLAGLEDWIARDREDYVARAIAAAGDSVRLAALRAGMRDRLRASPLADEPAFARRLEAAYRGMWRAWCASPDSRLS